MFRLNMQWLFAFVRVNHNLSHSLLVIYYVTAHGHRISMEPQFVCNPVPTEACYICLYFIPLQVNGLLKLCTFVVPRNFRQGCVFGLKQLKPEKTRCGLLWVLNSMVLFLVLTFLYLPLCSSMDSAWVWVGSVGLQEVEVPPVHLSPWSTVGQRRLLEGSQRH